ncbi:glutamate 5-kinase [Gloeobacter morelensis]|uniref:Glutamate 5-kinase n=1 Tax=Gloeobacter morelensis MG652769 TaxID=2781736 RepID=A0ABY3PK72_9CYAN|nr:glutamate 5-kinase [Gloeobacter morelensis]UFP94060.1 glutamate 5-kinase [Gloeobacter morelensis MG652769]
MVALVVKIGTSSLSDPSTGDLRLATLGGLAETLTRLRRAGHRIILVSSGAVGVGCARLGLKERPATVAGKQAAAAVGQGLLMSMYDRLFGALGQPVAQVLLTRQDLMDRARYLNARETLSELWRLGALPIVNENDTVATDELRFGDNDALSALVAGLVEAQWLVLLTDVAGLYSANPRLDPQARLLSEVTEISEELLHSARGRSLWGSGGMASKLAAARIAASAGVTTVITEGSTPQNIERILAGEAIGTRFVLTRPGGRLSLRKRWIGYGLVPAGALHLDEGAVLAVREGGKSLLPAGVSAVEGHFETGALVRLIDGQGLEFARGLVNYSSEELEKIRGRKSGEIAALLGIEGQPPTAVHRDNLITLS